ncbi:MAG: hypothetical protein ABFD00_09955 [Chloroherpetonaceae bacterium]
MQKKVMFLIGFALLQAISLFAQPQPTDEVVWMKFKDDCFHISQYFQRVFRY